MLKTAAVVISMAEVHDTDKIVWETGARNR